MGLERILQLIQETRTQLEAWGITAPFLAVCGAISLLLFVVSLREVLTWYLRIPQIATEVKGLRLQIEALTEALESARLKPDAEEAISPAEAETPAPAPSETAERALFRLDH